MKDYEYKDGFKFFSMFRYRGAALIKEGLIIDNNNFSMYIKYINENNINKIIIDSYNSGIDNLDFLKDIKHIEYLKIYASPNMDITGIYQLENLKYLYIIRHNEIDLSKFKKIEFFSTNNIRGVTNLDKAVSLKTLTISDEWYKCNYTNLEFLSSLKSLDSLHIRSLNILTLKGIEKLDKLTVLQLDNLKKLRSISMIANHKNIQNLDIYGSSKIEDLDIIGTLKKLKFLQLHNVKGLTSIEILDGIPEMNTFISDNSIVNDYNLTPLMRLNTVFLIPFKKDYFIINNGKKERAKSNQLPYGERNYGHDEIEKWRRISF